jgi:hypothetical protein
MGLLHPLLRLVRAHRLTSSVVTPWGYKSRQSPLHTPISSHTIRHSLLTSFPIATTLWPRASQPNPLRGPAHRGLRDFVRPPFQSIELFLPCLTYVRLGRGANNLRGMIIDVKFGHGTDPKLRSMKWW